MSHDPANPIDPALDKDKAKPATATDRGTGDRGTGDRGTGDRGTGDRGTGDRGGGGDRDSR